jgi:hypothetical protein
LFDNTGNSAIIDEYTFGQMQDRGAAYNALKQHWDTWITEDDFAQIAGKASFDPLLLSFPSPLHLFNSSSPLSPEPRSP